MLVLETNSKDSIQFAQLVSFEETILKELLKYINASSAQESITISQHQYPNQAYSQGTDQSLILGKGAPL